jgi:hypothetical protein
MGVAGLGIRRVHPGRPTSELKFGIDIGQTSVPSA